MPSEAFKAIAAASRRFDRVLSIFGASFVAFHLAILQLIDCEQLPHMAYSRYLQAPDRPGGEPSSHSSEGSSTECHLRDALTCPHVATTTAAATTLQHATKLFGIYAAPLFFIHLLLNFFSLCLQCFSSLFNGRRVRISFEMQRMQRVLRDSIGPLISCSCYSCSAWLGLAPAQRSIYNVVRNYFTAKAAKQLAKRRKIITPFK